MDSSRIAIERVSAISPEIEQAFGRLVPQLTTNNPAPIAADLAALIEAHSTVLLVARDVGASGRIVGAGSVASYRVPTGVRAVIEDVVVDVESRGRGIGEALMIALLDAARELGAHGVSLTSNPARESANRLYIRLGFQLRHTNCYYYSLSRHGT